MKTLFAYIRVSTPRQGEQGVSLNQQRDAISRYAEHQGLQIAEWFEERQTAAKANRPIFRRMIALLAKGRASGVIIHKIDRSARNLKDWADLGELIDRGVEVHFAHETLDLHSRGGRLSADIQAVVAADYVRNLRQETIKGFYGRLKQGLYPRPAPLGYTDRGAGQPKAFHPTTAPLVRQAFELYATGRYTLETLGHALFERGLATRRATPLSETTLAYLLKNPFYIGVIRIFRTNQTFLGIHPPLIAQSLFDRVQEVLSGKTARRVSRHQYLFRRLVRCAHCGFSLIGERQKGHVYYRCHTAGCATRCVREDSLDAAVRAALMPLQFHAAEREQLAAMVREMLAHDQDAHTHRIAAARLQMGRLSERIQRLTDLYLDQGIERAEFEQRKTALLLERRSLDQQLACNVTDIRDLEKHVQDFLELAGNASLLYERADPDEKRELLQITTSNRTVDGKTPMFTLAPAFQVVAERGTSSCGGPHHGGHRTRPQWLRRLSSLLQAQEFDWSKVMSYAPGRSTDGQLIGRSPAA